MDIGKSGTISPDEALLSVSTMWPLLQESETQIAFAVADRKRSGEISTSDVPLLLRCLIWLNRKRHQVHEILYRCSQDGVGENEFRLGCRVLDVLQEDTENMDETMADNFMSCCAQLDADDLLVDFRDPPRPNAAQFVAWAVDNECSLALEPAERAELMEKEVPARSGEYGDVFFTDLADVLVEFSSATKTKSKVNPSRWQRSKTLTKIKRAAKSDHDRVAFFKTGIHDALTRIDSFPEFADEVSTSLAHACSTDGLFSGQYIMTQGELEYSFCVLCRGRAEIIIDDVLVDTVGPGSGFGEMGLLFGTRRGATIRCAGPCEVLYLDRETYQTEVAKLRPEHRVGRLQRILLKLWNLCISDDNSQVGTSGKFHPATDATGHIRQTTVGFATYRKLHIRAAKTLTMQENEQSYDEDEHRRMSGKDWTEDCRRYELRADGRLTMTMFFDCMYQLVDLWATGVEVSFSQFLEDLYENIADYNPVAGHDKFKATHKVGCIGEKFEQAKEDAAARRAAVEKARQDALDKAERLRLEAETARQVLLASYLHSLCCYIVGMLTLCCVRECQAALERAKQAAQQQREYQAELERAEQAAQEERDQSRKELEALDNELRRLQPLLAKLEAEEVKLRRQLAAAGLNAYEEETIHRRLAAIQQERVHGTNHLESSDIDTLGIQFQILNLAEQREWNKLSAGGLSEQETAVIRRRLADIKHERATLHSHSIQEDEAEMERRRRNRSGPCLVLVEPSGDIGGSQGQTDNPEARLRRLAAQQALEILHKRIARLDIQEQALLHRMKNGNQNVCGNQNLKEQTAQVQQQRQELILVALNTEQKELERCLSNDGERQSTAAEKEAWHTRIEEIQAEKTATVSTRMAAKDNSEGSMASALLVVSRSGQNRGTDSPKGQPHDTLQLSGGLGALQQTCSSVSPSRNQQDSDGSHSSQSKSHGKRTRRQRSRRRTDESWTESIKRIDPSAELAARMLPPACQRLRGNIIIVSSSTVLGYPQALLRVSPPKHADRKGNALWIQQGGFKTSRSFKLNLAQISATRKLAPLDLKVLRRSPSVGHDRPWSRGATTYVAQLPLVPRRQ